MKLQKLIDGLKAHRNGAAAYESVDEAIRVLEAMRDVDGEKVVNGLERFRADFKPFVGNSCDWERVDAALALIRQQQERIKELEAGQTARVMVLEEVCGWAKGEPLFIEEEMPSGNFCGYNVFHFSDYQYVCFTPFRGDGSYFLKEDYGLTWRCWTHRPTDEQRKAVKWDG